LKPHELYKSALTNIEIKPNFVNFLYSLFIKVSTLVNEINYPAKKQCSNSNRGSGSNNDPAADYFKNDSTVKAGAFVSHYLTLLGCVT
jgi:hypothetical protein